MPTAMIAESWWLIGDSSSKTCAVTACYTDRWAPGIGTHAEAVVHGVPVNSFYSLQIGSREVLRWWSTKWCHKHGYAECGGIPASGLLPLPPTPIVSCLPAKLRLVELWKGENMWERPKWREGVSWVQSSNISGVCDSQLLIWRNLSHPKISDFGLCVKTLNKIKII
jgi:hypothetical protein